MHYTMGTLDLFLYSGMGSFVLERIWFATGLWLAKETEIMRSICKTVELWPVNGVE